MPDWGMCQKLRRERLSKLLKLNAPESLIDRECVLLRKAIHRTHNGRTIALKDFYHWLRFELVYAWMTAQLNWYLYILHWPYGKAYEKVFEFDPTKEEN